MLTYLGPSRTGPNSYETVFNSQPIFQVCQFIFQARARMCSRSNLEGVNILYSVLTSTSQVPAGARNDDYGPVYEE
jgi:hypothetical protein